MRRLTWILQLACLVLPTAAWAQVPECQGFTNVTPVAENQPVVRPPSFSTTATITVLLLDGKTPENAIINGVGNNWSAANVQQIRGLIGANEAFLVWSQLGQPNCRYRISLAAQPQAGGAQPPAAQPPAAQPPAAQPPVAVTPPAGFSGRAIGRLYRPDECAIAGQEWLSEVAGGTRGASVLLFDQDGQLCAPPPLRPRQGDAIYVGVFTDGPEWSASRITFQPCMLQSPTPNVLASGRLSDISQLRSADPLRFRIYAFPVRYCWNSPVAIEITSADGNRRMNYSLEQVTLYRATLHFGTVFTENHDVTFGLRPDGPNTERIFAQGPVDKGPEYVAALVFYSLPRYFMRGGFAGRDPVADTGWKDRLGGLVGVGLQNPTERFVAGFSFEVAAGVNIIGVWDWVETEVLRGVEEGDIFVGEPEDIPTQKEWRQKFVFGLTLDIVYAATAFRR